VAKWVRVGRADEVCPGEKRIYEVDGIMVVVVNLGGEYFCVEDVCTHDGGPLGEGDLHDGQLVCPRHGARFDVRTGRALALPAFEPVATYQVKVQDGDLLIESY
jgi:3-phenylpropionate/trans-cinnamate dioxygenase ferredoxin subunit